MDHDLFSAVDHELNYLLKKWGKKRTKKNQQVLRKKIEEFKSISSYSPHNRDSFYVFVKNRRIKALLDTLTFGKKKKKSPLQSKIQKKAHDIYVQRAKDAIPGNAFTDWLQAEKEIQKERKKNK